MQRNPNWNLITYLIFHKLRKPPGKHLVELIYLILISKSNILLVFGWTRASVPNLCRNSARKIPGKNINAKYKQESLDDANFDYLKKCENGRNCSESLGGSWGRFSRKVADLHLFCDHIFIIFLLFANFFVLFAWSFMLCAIPGRYYELDIVRGGFVVSLFY